MKKKYDIFHKKSKTSFKVINNNNFTYINLLKIINGEILGQLNSKSNILDVGCGVGTISFYLAKKGFNIVGIDISSKAIKTARETASNLALNKNTSFSFGDIQSFKLKKKNLFDLIICSEVIEHLKNDEKTLKKLHGYLKPKGILLVSVPSKNAPLYRSGIAKKFDKEVGHLRRYSIKELTKIVKGVGFYILNIKRAEGLLRNSLFLLKPLGKIIKYIKGPIVYLVSWLDYLSLILFGESQIFIVAQKK
ncbi:class I SAM-dependent methyltransferase [Patescibacteria group bacterium]